MAAETLTVPMPGDRLAALDALAQSRKTDRAALVNEAVSDFLAQQAGWLEHLAAGLRQADAGEFASVAEVSAAFAPRFRPG